MPTVLRWNGYRFFFYSVDGYEPAHIHVAKNNCQVKIWLNSLAVAVNIGYSARELNEIICKTRDSRVMFLEQWNDHFADRG